MDLGSIKSFLQTLHGELAGRSNSNAEFRVDLLIGNAGFVPVGNLTTADGWEVSS